MNIFRRLARAVHRRAIARRIQDWGNELERLDRQRLHHADNVERALARLHEAKRALAELDGPTRRITHAPGRGRTDGVRRFSLTEDKPQAPATAAVTVMFRPQARVKARRA